MNDIPIGSPPVPPGRHAAPQGWYPDPVDGSRERYWDGWEWSRDTRPGQRPSAPAGRSTAGPGPRQANSPGWNQTQTTRSGRGARMLTPDGVPVAGWGWRFLAGIVDLILVEIVATLAALPFITPVIGRVSDYLAKSMRAAEHGATTPPPVPTDLVTSSEQLWITVITVAVGIAYFAIMWRLASATLGQLLCGLRIVPLGQGRQVRQLDWGVSVLRAVLWSVPLAIGSLLLIFTVINVFTPLFQSNRQALHDLAARTQVVKVR